MRSLIDRQNCCFFTAHFCSFFGTQIAKGDNCMCRARPTRFTDESTPTVRQQQQCQRIQKRWKQQQAKECKRGKKKMYAIILKLPCFIRLLKFRAHSNRKSSRSVCLCISDIKRFLCFDSLLCSYFSCSWLMNSNSFYSCDIYRFSNRGHRIRFLYHVCSVLCPSLFHVWRNRSVLPKLSLSLSLYFFVVVRYFRYRSSNAIFYNFSFQFISNFI